MENKNVKTKRDGWKIKKDGFDSKRDGWKTVYFYNQIELDFLLFNYEIIMINDHSTVIVE